MKTKEAIDKLNSGSKAFQTNSILDMNIKELINLLKRGERFEEMWGVLEYELDWHKPEEPLYCAKLEFSKNEEYLDETLDMMSDIKKKYFPKED